jgi:hypothetical protein
MTPRIRLAHRITRDLLQQAGLTLPVPEPDAGVLEQACAWLDGGGEGVMLLTGSRRWPVATIVFSPDHRSAVATVHVAQLSQEPDHPELVADVTAISAELLADLGFTEGAP